jgi:predicted kinase
MYIIVVTGLPGSGKSYFARRLAVRLDAKHINSDAVRKALGASGRYSFEDKLVVYTQMAKITERFLDEHKDVVVDATFYHPAMRDIFLTIAQLRNIDICFIQITAKESLIEERLKKPREDSEADFQVYKNIRDQLQQMTNPHLNLESTNDNIESMLDEAIAYIGNLHDHK